VPNASANSSAYHHGNLREALIAGALALEPAHGPLGVSLREVAREVGVTHAAAYHHFASKEALLVAVAEQGFEQLLAALDREPVPVANPFFAVIANASGYARYAVRNPSQFRFMYGTSPASAEPLAAQHARVLDRFAQAVRDAQAAQVIAAGAPARPAAQIWSAAHGIAVLTVSGALDGVPRARAEKRSPKQTERRTLDLVRATIVGLLFGMAADDSPWRRYAKTR
jgi:AcrR family transcriptional regulator